MSHLRRFSLALAFALSLAGAPNALADKRDAKRYADEATLAYKLGHFQEALDAFTKAYEAFPAPLLLFDLGQCNRELGNNERALFFLRGYLHDVPNAKNRKLVLDLIAETEKKLAAQQAQAEAQRAAQAQAAATAAAIAPPGEATRPSPTGPATAVVPEPQASHVDRVALEAQRRSGQALALVGVGLAVAGAVALGVGVYFGAKSNSDAGTVSQLSSTGGVWTSQAEATYRDGPRSAVTADVLFGCGGVAVLTGAVLGYLGWNQRSSALAQLTVGVAPRPGGAETEVAWAF